MITSISVGPRVGPRAASGLHGPRSTSTRTVDRRRLFPPNAAEAVNDPQDHVRAVSGRRLRDDLDRLAGISTGMAASVAQEARRQIAKFATWWRSFMCPRLGSVGDNVTSRRYKQKLQDRITS